MRRASFRFRRQNGGGDQPGVIQLFGQNPKIVFQSKGLQVGEDVEYPFILHLKASVTLVNERLIQL
jgi:hypothetical protein